MDLKITEHFSFSELTHTDHADLQEINRAAATGSLQNLCKLAKELERVRAFFGKVVIIYSAFRCSALNERVGSKAQHSQHLTGEAADFVVDGYKDPKGLDFVFNWCKNNTDYGQLILEQAGGKSWIHLGLPRAGRDKTAYIFDGKEYRPA